MSFLSLAVLALAGAAGCGDDLTPKTKLRDARILAVRSEPVNPGVGETTTFTPFLYIPAGETPVYQWSWCPLPTDPNDGYQCPIDQAGLDQLVATSGLTGVPPLDLGTLPTVTFANPFPSVMLAALCAGDPAALGAFFGAQGMGAAAAGVFQCGIATFPVQVKLTVSTEKGSDAAVFSLNLPIDETTPRNLNPVIGGLWDITTPPGILLDDVGTEVRPAGRDVEIAVDMDESVSESYLDKVALPNGEYQRDAAGNLVLGPTRERITVSWFKEFGGLDTDSTGFRVSARDAQGNPIPFDVARKNTWTVPDEAVDLGKVVRLVAVVRDGRGGVAWTQGAMTVGVAQ